MDVVEPASADDHPPPAPPLLEKFQGDSQVPVAQSIKQTATMN